MPKAMHSEAGRRLREMSAAPMRSECERLRDEYVVDLSADGRIDAAETVVPGLGVVCELLRLTT